MRSFLDSNAPSDGAEAKAQFSGVVTAISDSELRAHLKYASMGGNPRSLLTFKTAVP